MIKSTQWLKISLSFAAFTGSKTLSVRQPARRLVEAPWNRSLGASARARKGLLELSILPSMAAGHAAALACWARARRILCSNLSNLRLLRVVGLLGDFNAARRSRQSARFARRSVETRPEQSDDPQQSQIAQFEHKIRRARAQRRAVRQRVLQPLTARSKVQAIPCEPAGLQGSDQAPRRGDARVADRKRLPSSECREGQRDFQPLCRFDHCAFARRNRKVSIASRLVRQSTDGVRAPALVLPPGWKGRPCRRMHRRRMEWQPGGAARCA